MYKYIKQNCHVAIGIATAFEVDKINVLKATHLAMKRAINNLPVIDRLVLIDGVYVPDGINNAQSIIKGDDGGIVGKINENIDQNMRHQKIG